ncbi:MAG TPA: L,D-transpeptidase family protein [Thermoanaerobaculia bacterium]|nr:L,D-transpeptidase family protein [Thermoanaerobaculia bacterium]
MIETRRRRLAWAAALLLAAFARPGMGQPADIRSLIAAGTLDGMRWPDFADCRTGLQELYESTGYAPVWMEGTQPRPQSLSMIRLFGDAEEKGLDPEDYDASRWAERIRSLQGSPDGAAAARFDVALTVCAMRYVSALQIGRINPGHFEFGLTVNDREYDLARFLRDRVLTAPKVQDVLDEVESPLGGYRHTGRALARYLELARADDGEKLPVVSRPVDPGQDYAGVPRLVRFLRLVGDLPADAAVPEDSRVYGGPVVEAVKRFQRRHGLEDDGRLGRATLDQLNVPLQDRVRQLELAMERWRWLAFEICSPLIVVNIPDFQLRALDEDLDVALEMRVVVGKAMRTQTPVFAAEMTHVVLRPYWNVPLGILRREILPDIRRDRRYVARKKYEITTPDGKVAASGSVSDDALARLRTGKLMLRQKPGSANSLGRVKLMFPNEYDVYLHDTPARELFSRSRRDFSHGCIRVEKAAELAAWVLRENPGWTLERVRQAMQSGKDDVTVRLAKPVPVFIVYATAAADESGDVRFYDDVYGHDAELAAALAQGYPYP